jgi:hypothetical protein
MLINYENDAPVKISGNALRDRPLKPENLYITISQNFAQIDKKFLDISWQPYLEPVVWSLAKDVEGCSCTFFLLTAFSPKYESRKYIF